MNPPLVSVYKDGNAWHWTCRVPMCHRSHWRGRHRDALRDAARHVSGHGRVGFTTGKGSVK